MPSAALQDWRTSRARALNQVEQAHAAVGGTGRGRRYATQQINHAYAVLLASHFQGFCRDLHSECVNHLVDCLQPAGFRVTVSAAFVYGRRLDRGNATPGNIGSDFNRLGLDFWARVKSLDARNESRMRRLIDLNEWWNAIAHEDFSTVKLGGRLPLKLAQVKRWRRARHRLSYSFDEVMRDSIQSVTGTSPW